jgi:hypothetical protein
VTGDTNHVPTEAVDAIDRFGEGLLTGDAPPVAERLRSDLRLRVAVGEEGARTARAAFHLDHGRREGTLRAYGPFVTTVVDVVDERLRAWGVEPPPAYRFADERDGWLVFAGTLQLLPRA